MTRTILFYSILLLAFNSPSYGQSKVSGLLNSAERAHKRFNFASALKDYKSVLEIEPNHKKALDAVIEIYLHDYEHFDSARAYLDRRIAGFEGDTAWSVYFSYAECLRMQDQHEQAIEMFEFFRHNGLKKQRPFSPITIAINQNIEYCQNAIRNFENTHIPFEVKNMGPFINSIDPEYTPVYLEEKNLLLYNARYQDFEDEFRSMDDKFFENIYYFDLTNNVASTYNPRNDQELHKAVVSEMYGSDTIIVFWKNQLWISGIGEDRLDEMEPMPLKIRSFYFQPHGIFTNDNNTIIFSGKSQKDGNLDIFISHRQDTSWTYPESISPKINTGMDEDGPYLSPDGQKLYFSSKGHLSSGGYDFFVSELVDGEWSSPVNLGYPMNSSGDDIYISFQKDGRKGYFSSNRNGGYGGMDIYYFEMLKRTIRGTVKDDKGNLLDSVEVKLIELETGEELIVRTNKTGDYSFLVDPQKKFTLFGSREGYFEDQNSADTYSEEDVVIANLSLEKDPGLALYCLITNTETGAPIDSVMVSLTDNMLDETKVFYTKASGDFFKALPDKKLQDRGSYNLTIEKEGYLSKTVTYNVLFDRAGRYNMHEDLDLSLQSADVGGDLTKLIDLLPIYFDVGKAKIRPDAAIELDKVVKVMNDNPEMIIELGSHTDSRGNSKSNQLLSDKRAKASANYIKKRITNPDRINGKGYGESKLVNDCADGVDCSELQHQQNRRTEFIIIQMKAPKEAKPEGE